MQRATLGKSGSEAASQLQGRIARAFSSNILVNTMDMRAAIQYILTAAQMLGSQDYYKKVSNDDTWACWCIFLRKRAGMDKMDSYVPKKMLTWMLREARGGLKTTVGNRVKPDYHFIHTACLFFSVSFSQILVFPGRLCSKTCQHILHIVGLSQAEV